ncbi:MAG: undecaprenyl-phosphate galactose phosphotransferase WbaP [Bryobacteraceae bacterium]
MAEARPHFCSALLMGSDVFTVTFAFAASISLWVYLGRPFDVGYYLALWPVLLLFPIAYAGADLYPGFGRNPAEELRKVSKTTSFVFAALAVTVFLMKDAPTYSRGVFVLAWAQSLVLVPLLRAVIRSTASERSWWGYPVIVIGNGAAAHRIAEELEKRPALGLRPIGVFEQPEPAVELARQGRVQHVVLTMAGTPRHVALETFEHCSELFTDVIVIPDLAGFASLWVEGRDLGGTLGLEVRQRLLLRSASVTKRVLDLFAVAVIGTVAAPIALLVAILIKLDSKGPVFYRQQRCGRGGSLFTAWKFRSMVADSASALEQGLQSDDALRNEWSSTQKLRRDPRITRVGRLLRRTSLDELPQLWNVLHGEMSLVGPRPIVEDEIARYGAGYALYKKVRPGLTGLWQVSGRNLVSYQERVEYDLYYVRNWSVWLDLHILARTIVVVISGEGAY